MPGVPPHHPPPSPASDANEPSKTTTVSSSLQFVNAPEETFLTVFAIITFFIPAFLNASEVIFVTVAPPSVSGIQTISSFPAYPVI